MSSVDEAAGPLPEFAPYAEALQLPPLEPHGLLAADEAKRDAALISQGFETYVADRPGPESFPSMALQVITMLGRPDASIEKLSTLVAREPGLTAALLRVVNTAMYKGVKRIVSVRDAIARLGLNEAGRIAGAAAARVLFDARGRASTLPYAADFEQLYVNAVTTGVTAGFIGVLHPPARADRCYLGGLLHDIGRAVALRALATLREQGASDLVPKSPRTHRVLDALHVPIGVDVAKIWQLPEFVIEMANSHHAAGLTDRAHDLELHVVGFASALQLLRSGTPHAGAARDLLLCAKALTISPETARKLDIDRARFEGLARTLATG